jgi:hypothetical protein
MENVLRAPRIPHASDAAVHLGGELILCRTWDISSTGMSLVCPYRRRTDRPVQVEFFLSQESGWLRAEAKLVRSDPFIGGFIWGIRFTDLEDRTASSIESHILGKLVSESYQATEIQPVPALA